MKLEDVTIGMRVQVTKSFFNPGTDLSQCVVYKISDEGEPWPISIEILGPGGAVTKGYVSPAEIEPYVAPRPNPVESIAREFYLEEAGDLLACGLVRAAGYNSMALLPIAYDDVIGDLSYKAIEAIADLMTALDTELARFFDEKVNNGG